MSDADKPPFVKESPAAEPAAPAAVRQEKALPSLRRTRLRKSASTVWKGINWGKIALFVISLFLFILAIMLMKEGAGSLTPLIRDRLAVDSPLNALGFGWLFAYIIMSGSPVAAAALTFLDIGLMGRVDAFTMISGSRLGASFIVLFIGFIYILRGRDKNTSLDMGLLSLAVTGTMHLIVLIAGVTMLQTGVLDQVHPWAGSLNVSGETPVFGSLSTLLASWLPPWALFLLGIATIMVSFSLFDKCLPEMKLKEGAAVRVSRLVYRPWVMFVLGAGITAISMSVSVSLSLLVPMSNRGFVRRENVIPYILGANITTFVDTLFAAVLLKSPDAFTVVFTQIISIILVSALILATFYQQYARLMLSFTTWVTKKDRNLILFMLGLLIVPLVLMLL